MGRNDISLTRYDMIDNYGLKDYDFSLCLMNDEDTDYVLVEFVNGKLKRSVVD